MRRVPLIPTILVAAAVAAMIALGIWQLHRATWKEAIIARFAAAEGKPPVAYPAVGGGEALLFRRSSLNCLQVTGWSIAAGRNRAGEQGWRRIAACRTGAEGPGAAVDAGWTKGFDGKPGWTGGRVTGVIAARPDHRSLVESLSGHGTPPGVLLVADPPAPGLAPSAPPSAAEIPNNHRGYAVQWFAFAGVALVIYAVALRYRMRRP